MSKKRASSKLAETKKRNFLIDAIDVTQLRRTKDTKEPKEKETSVRDDEDPADDDAYAPIEQPIGVLPLFADCCKSKLAIKCPIKK